MNKQEAIFDAPYPTENYDGTQQLHEESKHIDKKCFQVGFVLVRSAKEY